MNLQRSLILKYNIVLQKAAEKFIKKQNRQQQEKLLKLIALLPDGKDVKKLKGYDSHYRLRVNDYRIIYIKQDDVYIITVINIDNRGDVYKGL